MSSPLNTTFDTTLTATETESGRAVSAIYALLVEQCEVPPGDEFKDAYGSLSSLLYTPFELRLTSHI